MRNNADMNKKEPKNFSSEEWILAFMYAGDRSIVHGKLMFIKQCFIASKEIVSDMNKSLNFYAYDYGPYSKVLAKTVNTLIDKGLIESKKDGDHWDFFLSEKGEEEAIKYYDSLPLDVQNRLNKLRKSANQLGYIGILRYVYTKYPEYTTVSKIKENIENDTF